VRRLFSTKRRIALAAAGGAIALVIGGTAAYAYFTTTGSGSGSATVGNETGTWNITAAGATGGPLYPGSGTETIVFTVENTGSSDQVFSTATPTVPVYMSTTDAETTGDADIAGCTASWFAPTVESDPSAGDEIAPDGTATVTVTVTLSAEDVNQDACEGASPDILLSVS
jgi:hypothetical protein